jgi:hypothetical protein
MDCVEIASFGGGRWSESYKDFIYRIPNEKKFLFVRQAGGATDDYIFLVLKLNGRRSMLREPCKDFYLPHTE